MNSLPSCDPVVHLQIKYSPGPGTHRAVQPAHATPQLPLGPKERLHSAGLMHAVNASVSAAQGFEEVLQKMLLARPQSNTAMSSAEQPRSTAARAVSLKADSQLSGPHMAACAVAQILRT